MKLQYPPQRAKRQRYGLLKLYYTPEHTSVILRLMLYVHVQRKEIKRPISYTIMSYLVSLKEGAISWFWAFKRVSDSRFSTLQVRV